MFNITLINPLNLNDFGVDNNYINVEKLLIEDLSSKDINYHPQKKLIDTPLEKIKVIFFVEKDKEKIKILIIKKFFEIEMIGSQKEKLNFSIKTIQKDWLDLRDFYDEKENREKKALYINLEKISIEKLKMMFHFNYFVDEHEYSEDAFEDEIIKFKKNRDNFTSSIYDLLSKFFRDPINYHYSLGKKISILEKINEIIELSDKVNDDKEKSETWYELSEKINTFYSDSENERKESLRIISPVKEFETWALEVKKRINENKSFEFLFSLEESESWEEKISRFKEDLNYESLSEKEKLEINKIIPLLEVSLSLSYKYKDSDSHGKKLSSNLLKLIRLRRSGIKASNLRTWKYSIKELSNYTRRKIDDFREVFDDLESKQRELLSNELEEVKEILEIYERGDQEQDLRGIPLASLFIITILILGFITFFVKDDNKKLTKRKQS